MNGFALREGEMAFLAESHEPVKALSEFAVNQFGFPQ
jgi:hypothetical protein